MMFPRVLHVLGTNQFGVWGAATSLITLVVIADFGVGSAILTLVARAPRHGRGRPALASTSRLP